MKTGRNWDKNSDETRVALRDDHDKSRRSFSRRRDSVYLPFFLFSTIGPLFLLLVHTHRSALILVYMSGRSRIGVISAFLERSVSKSSLQLFVGKYGNPMIREGRDTFF